MPRDIVTILGELSALPIVFPDVEGASGKGLCGPCRRTFSSRRTGCGPDPFGEEPTWKVGGADYKMDRFEIDLIRAFYEAGKPILAFAAASRSSILPLAVRFIKIFRLTAPVLTSATAKSLRGLSRPPCKCQERQLAPCGLGGYGLCKLSASSGLEGCSQGSCCYGYGTGWCH